MRDERAVRRLGPTTRIGRSLPIEPSAASGTAPTRRSDLRPAANARRDRRAAPRCRPCVEHDRSILDGDRAGEHATVLEHLPLRVGQEPERPVHERVQVPVAVPARTMRHLQHGRSRIERVGDVVEGHRAQAGGCHLDRQRKSIQLGQHRVESARGRRRRGLSHHGSRRASSLGEQDKRRSGVERRDLVDPLAADPQPRAAHQQHEQPDPAPTAAVRSVRQRCRRRARSCRTRRVPRAGRSPTQQSPCPRPA